MLFDILSIKRYNMHMCIKWNINMYKAIENKSWK